MINSRKQTGSALVVIIIIVAVAILGALGYVLWNNFLAPNEETKQVNNSSEQVSDAEETKVVGKTYESDAYTFQYPKEEWELFEEHFDIENPDKMTPVVKTSNWEQTGMGLDAGAEVSINTYPASKSLAELKEATRSFADGTVAKDLVVTEVDGVAAYSYRASYEGNYYATVFIHNGVEYHITYEYADNVESRFYYDGYDMIVASFKLT